MEIETDTTDGPIEPHTAGVKLTPLDRRLMTELQADMPLTVAPFRELGERLGVTEAEVVERGNGHLAHPVLLGDQFQLNEGRFLHSLNL